MAATKTSAIIAGARIFLNEPTERYWKDAELLELAKRGYTDLWAAINDLNQEHFLTVDETNVSLAASSYQLTGVPNDTFRVHLIEPRDTTTAGNNRDVFFYPRDYNHKDFITARSQEAFDPFGDLVIYYTLTGAGSPVGAPIVRTAPKINSAMNLRFVYVPALNVSSYTLDTNNPIPGEADNAVIAWVVAFARAKEREDNAPDPAWLAVYATEKQSLLTRLTPRQTQEPEYVEGMFEEYWS